MDSDLRSPVEEHEVLEKDQGPCTTEHPSHEPCPHLRWLFHRRMAPELLTLYCLRLLGSASMASMTFIMTTVTCIMTFRFMTTPSAKTVSRHGHREHTLRIEYVRSDCSRHQNIQVQEVSKAKKSQSEVNEVSLVLDTSKI